jgi:hypothetical protein
VNRKAGLETLSPASSYPVCEVGVYMGPEELATRMGCLPDEDR